MTLKSMTAFGNAEERTPHCAYRCEIRTLNSRFIDINVRLPRFLNSLETEIIQQTKATLNRGKVDIFFDVQLAVSTDRLPKLNPLAVQHYLQLWQQTAQHIKEQHGNYQPSLPSIGEVFRWEGVLETTNASDPEQQLKLHRQGIMDSLNAALAKVQDERSREGKSLRTALLELLQEMAKNREAIAVRASEFLGSLFEAQKKRLDTTMAKLRQADNSLVSSISEERLHTEVALLVDKCDIQEEITRLGIHEQEFRRLLDEVDCGRKLDFLCQEMHREVNTMSNKLVNTEAAKHTLAMKHTIERLRQQVQNIE